MHVVQAQDVAVGKHGDLDVLPHIPYVAPVRHASQRSLLLPRPTVDSEELTAGRLQHLGISDGLVAVLEDADLAGNRYGELGMQCAH